jgi:hippurate hydrolase
MSSNSSLQNLIDQQLPEFIQIREHIHQHPELSFQEFETSAFICSKLDDWGISYQKGYAGTGILASIQGRNPDKQVIAFRADMDALPIVEMNEVAYASKNKGVMHACGHDVHSTCLLGAIRILNEIKNEWEGTIQCIFQPGEEKHPGGASLLIKEGILENPKPAAIFALHVYPHLPYGSIGYRAGQYMASADEIYIRVIGKGGHAALPHQTVDPIIISAQLLTSLQQIISRNCNPLQPSVLSFGKIAGGQAGNVIPDEVRIEGTLRCMDEKWRAKAHDLIRKHTIELCRALGGDAEIEIPMGYPSLFNDPQVTRQFQDIAEKALGVEQVKELDLRMAAEDFSFYTHQVPGCFFRIGTSKGNEFQFPVHNARFDIYQPSIAIGVRMFCEIAIHYKHETN